MCVCLFSMQDVRFRKLGSDAGVGSICADDLLHPDEVDRYIEEAVKEPTASELNIIAKECARGLLVDKSRRTICKVPRKNKSRMRAEESAQENMSGGENKKQDRTTKARSIGCVKIGKPLQEKTRGSATESKSIDFQSICSRDFEGLLSEKSLGESPREKHHSVIGQSIHDSDFNDMEDALIEGHNLEDGNFPAETPNKDCDDDQSDGMQDREFGLQDIVNGSLPQDWDNERVSDCIKLVIRRNQSLQRELEATLDSIDAAVENNSKAQQLVRALNSMRLTTLKSARPTSSCGNMTTIIVVLLIFLHFFAVNILEIMMYQASHESE